MGSNTPKTDLDREYRALAARFLESVMDDRGMNKGALAKALGVDRSVASRYLSRDVRAPLQRLHRLKRSLGIDVPEDLAEAFWRSEEGPPQSAPHESDIENAIRHVGAELGALTDETAKARARKELETLLRKLA